jgi:hypothetical protein
VFELTRSQTLSFTATLAILLLGIVVMVEGDLKVRRWVRDFRVAPRLYDAALRVKSNRDEGKA